MPTQYLPTHSQNTESGDSRLFFKDGLSKQKPAAPSLLTYSKQSGPLSFYNPDWKLAITWPDTLSCVEHPAWYFSM